MQKISLFKLFLIFVKIGAILLGGGYVILPILINEFVERRNLISQDELLNYFALSQSLPGIIAANISMFVGYKLQGKRGALIAVLGIITVPFLIIASLASIIENLTENIYIRGVFWGVGVAVIALIMLTVKEMWQKANKNLYFYIIFIASLFSLILLDFSPIKTILIFIIIGVIYKRLTTPKEAR
jgi:chromate transporter